MADQLTSLVKQMQAEGVPESDILAFVQKFDSESPTKSPEPSTAKRVTSSLPTAGAMAASMLGGSRATPIGMALAGVGGAAGEAYRQVADSIRGDFADVPDTVMGRLKKIGQTGLEQAGMELGGRAMGAVMQPIAKTLYGLALRPSKALMRDAGGGKLLQGAKRIVNQGYADNVMPSGLGTSKAGRLVTESAQDATALAAKSPTTVKTARVLSRATQDQGQRAAKELATSGITPKATQVAEQIANIEKANPADLSMAELLKIRRGAEDVAAPVFKAAKMPGGAGRVATGSEASVARSVSGAAKQTLDDVLGEPFKAVNRRTQARMAVKQAVDEAAARPNMLANLLAGGAGVASSGGDPIEAAKRALMLRVMFSPTALGGTALAIGKAPYAQLLRTAQLAQLRGEQ